MTSVSWDDEEKTAASNVRWQGRTHINFVAGRSRLRTLPVVIHILPRDIGWFSADASLFDELKLLLRERVISATGNGDKDAEAPKSRKRARKEEVCIQGERLQFTYRYRKTLPRYTVLSYTGEDIESANRRNSSAGSSKGKRSVGSKSSGGGGPAFRHLPLSESTLLVWVYPFDKDDPYRPVPNEAALQFASSTSTPAAADQKPLDVEAIGRRSGTGTGATVGVQGGPRDTGLLTWLWGGVGEEGGTAAGGVKGGVRQHFIGSASWQGKSPSGQRREEDDDDIQRAIALSLAVEPRAEGGGVEERATDLKT
ncbi:unnamed protein product [Ectocarpus sp. CCAP 1310/34]|nr:unnamed protein product [Ectocarpus sp. CCAP 1310/34]